jgi:hypothetical protein
MVATVVVEEETESEGAERGREVPKGNAVK